MSTSPLSQFTLNNSLSNTSGDVLGHWSHTLANGSETSLQIYDTVMRHTEAGVNVANNTFDADFEHHLAAGSRHDIVWGLDYRFSSDVLTHAANSVLTATPSSRIDNLFAVFAQDEIRLQKALFLTVGSKFEHNSYTGFEFEPSAQLVWTPSGRRSLWASAARAIRQPDHIDLSVQFNEGVISAPPFGSALLKVLGNPRIQAERLNDYEAGYREQFSPRLSLDVTAFFSFYKHLETDEPQSPFIDQSGASPFFVIPVMFQNLGSARTRGIEVFANVSVNKRWRVSPGFSMINMTTSVDPGSRDATLGLAPGYMPKYQPQVRSLVNLRRDLEWDSSLKFVSRLTAPNVPGYVRLDSRLGWRIGESMEISVTGQNLATSRHIEFGDISNVFLTTEAARSIFGKVLWRF